MTLLSLGRPPRLVDPGWPFNIDLLKAAEVVAGACEDHDQFLFCHVIEVVGENDEPWNERLQALHFFLSQLGQIFLGG